MAAAIDIYNDILNNKLVLGINSQQPFTFGNLFQGSKLSIRYFPVLPIVGAVTGTFFRKVPLDNLTLEIAVGQRAGAESLEAFQGTWTPQTGPDAEGVSGYFHGILDLNMAPLNSAIGSLSEYNTFFEIRLAENGDKRPTYQQQITITAVVLGPGAAGSLPTPAASYYTKAEIDALCVKWDNTGVSSRGKAIKLSSPNGTRKRIMGSNNDGSARDDLI